MPQAASTRWCPTPEQLMILEEMYRGGIRTPNASQIQQITAHLSFYGRIEGKNVFYWFQNHKARDRQKLRRKLSRQPQQHPQHQQQLMESSAASTQLPNENPHHFLYKGCLEEATAQVKNFSWQQTNAWKKEGTEEMETPAVAYGQEWPILMDVGPTTCYRPLKTLDLFPIKSTGLKEELNVSKPFSCSTSNN